MGVKGRICCYGSLMVVLGFIMFSLSFLQMSDKCSLQQFKNSYVVPFAQVDSVNDSRPQQQIPLMEETSKTTKFNLSTIGDDKTTKFNSSTIGDDSIGMSAIGDDKTTKFNSLAIGDDSIGMLQQCCFFCQCFIQYPRKLRSIIWFTCDAHNIYIVVQTLYNQTCLASQPYEYISKFQNNQSILLKNGVYSLGHPSDLILKLQQITYCEPIFLL